jgi:hypothetical protein
VAARNASADASSSNTPKTPWIDALGFTPKPPPSPLPSTFTKRSPAAPRTA